MLPDSHTLTRASICQPCVAVRAHQITTCANTTSMPWAPRTLIITVRYHSLPVPLLGTQMFKHGVNWTSLQASHCFLCGFYKEDGNSRRGGYSTRTQPDSPAALLSSCPKTPRAPQSARDRKVPTFIFGMSKKPKSEEFTTWPALLKPCSSLLSNSLLSLSSDLSSPDSRGYRKVSVIDFQPIQAERAS